MGKLLVSIGIVIAVTAALVVYLTRDQTTPKDQALSKEYNEPRVILDDFAVYRYKNHRPISTFSAKLGHFLEPNIIEAYAAVRGVRYLEDSIESLQCEAATAFFESDNLNQLMAADNTQISSAEVEDRVRVGIGEHVVRTEHARYTAADQILRSREPVQVDGPRRMFIGEEGFSYNLEKETLEMPGPVKGVVESNEFNGGR